MSKIGRETRARETRVAICESMRRLDTEIIEGLRVPAWKQFTG